MRQQENDGPGWYLYYPPGEDMPWTLQFENRPSDAIENEGPFATESSAWQRADEIVTEMVSGMFSSSLSVDEHGAARH